MNRYEMMVILNEEFNYTELKTWSFNYARTLKTLRATDISVISLGKRSLAYTIKNFTKGNYIQIHFSIVPQFLTSFSRTIKLDQNVLRFLIFNRKNKL